MSTYRRFDELRIGDMLPPSPARFEVSEKTARDFARVTGDPFMGSDAEAAQTAPLMIAAIYVPAALKARNGPPGGIHAKQRFVFHRPPRIGETLFTQGVVLEKYQKKGRNYYVIETTTRDAHGDLVTTGLTTGIWGAE